MPEPKRVAPQNAREAKKAGEAWVRIRITEPSGGVIEVTGPFTMAKTRALYEVLRRPEASFSETKT